MAIGWSFSSVTGANVRKRSTRKVLLRTGPVLLALGLFGVFMGLQLHLPPLLMVAQALIGMGFGISNGYTLLSLIEASSAEDRDRTSALIPTTQSAGNAIGAAIAGLAANAAGYAVATTEPEVLASIVPLFATGIVIAVLAAIAAFAMVQRVQLSPEVLAEQAVPSAH